MVVRTGIPPLYVTPGFQSVTRLLGIKLSVSGAPGVGVGTGDGPGPGEGTEGLPLASLEFDDESTGMLEKGLPQFWNKTIEIPENRITVTNFVRIELSFFY
jgi:hypothetical protein